ncbi:MAG: hypothetical protein U0175_18120 [Caldilineaceae bacterium]
MNTKKIDCTAGNFAQFPQIIYKNDDFKSSFVSEANSLIKAAFEGNKDVRINEKLSGYSGAHTWRVVTDTDGVFVVKITSQTGIERETKNYADYVSGKYDNAVVPEDVVICDDGNWALHKTTYAGLSSSKTLLQYLEDKREKDPRKLLTETKLILDEIFDRNGIGWWQKGETAKESTCSIYYDRLLPEHLRLTKFDIPTPSAITLKSGEITPAQLLKIERGTIVKLVGFTVDKVRGNSSNLNAKSPEDIEAPRIRIKIDGFTDFPPGTEVAEIYGQVTSQRQELLNDIIKKFLPGFLVESKIIRTEEITPQWKANISNPLYFLQDLLNKSRNMYVSTIHGDLNLGNILVKTGGQDLQYRGHRLIDFSETGKGPILLDMQWFEANVIAWLLAPAIEKANLNIDTLNDIFTALHHRRSLTSLPTRLRTAIQTPYTVLLALRQLIQERQYLVRGWDEYYQGLAIALVSISRFEELKSDFCRRTAFLSASTVLNWADIGAVEPKRKESWGQWFRDNATQVLLSVVSIALFIIILRFMLLWPPIPPISTPRKLVDVTICYAVDENDRDGPLGSDQAAAIKLAAQYYNLLDIQQLTGLNIKLKHNATNNTLEDARRAFIALAAPDKSEQPCDAIIGPTYSTQAQNQDQSYKLGDDAHDIAEENGIPTFAPSNTANDILKGRKVIIRVSAPVAVSAKYVVRAVINKASGGSKIRNAVILYAGKDNFSLSESDAISQELKLQQIEPLAVPYINDNYKPTAWLHRSADLFVVSGKFDDAESIVEYLKNIVPLKLIIAGNGLNASPIFTRCNPQCGDIFIAEAYRGITFTIDSKSEIYPGINKQNMELALQPQGNNVSTEPVSSQIMAQAFTAVQVIVESFAELNNQGALAGKPITERRTLLLQKVKTKDFQTLLGEIWFDSHGEICQTNFRAAKVTFPDAKFQMVQDFDETISKNEHGSENYSCYPKNTSLQYTLP